MYFTYIIYSKKIDKYYAGFTADLVKRLRQHGKDKKKFTGRSDDWELVRFFEFETKSEAMKLETLIKKRSIKRFLVDISNNIVL